MSLKAAEDYFLSAAKHLINNEVKLESVVEEPENKETRFHFKVVDYSVILHFTYNEEAKCYNKWWSCTCHHGSGSGVKYQIECNHIMSAQSWLILNKINKSFKKIGETKWEKLTKSL